MKKVLLVCVNYNSNDKLYEYIDSLQQAYALYQDKLYLNVLVGDNSKIVDFRIPPKIGFDIKLIDNKGNYGYLGGVNKALKLTNTSPSIYDFFLITNVDVRVSGSFFNDLINLQFTDNVGWVAPSILSDKEKRDRNPKTLNRPSKFKMRLGILMYKYSPLHKLYKSLFYNRTDKYLPVNRKDNCIYAGHGSFIIFTKNFLKHKPDFSFPGFLFGEEIFFGELLLLYKLKTLYCPKIKIYDFDHASTGLMNNKLKNKFRYDSMKCIFDIFFR